MNEKRERYNGRAVIIENNIESRGLVINESYRKDKVTVHRLGVGLARAMSATMECRKDNKSKTTTGSSVRVSEQEN